MAAASRTGSPGRDRILSSIACMRAAVTLSINRPLLEDTLSGTAPTGVAHLRQEAGLLGFALMVNSLTLARHRVREAVRTTA